MAWYRRSSTSAHSIDVEARNGKKRNDEEGSHDNLKRVLGGIVALQVVAGLAALIIFILRP
ncbi:hypothetical protein VD0002_g5977 [Verticillium dahliae]|uniref:Uncharacterized protein n=1 Tax=Verticillium dahliae TaxID=27337 RepID=A0A2J8CP18_VERDA|nr:hypothetical protein BJF96_g4251 [Verticillium dahliae]PNH38743.1 hypothetical protein VD0004_g8098 [Verticillium dahliae]PNH49469.1 hypothetical protein VD0003_g7671 [Verticillium dahliae]PNH61940.1 hypothetical protein VD0002_g5977 [Verticillium dahliae]PNH66935.1 hypothetical protein VD0001_g7993 [Verticillium dahliae]